MGDEWLGLRGCKTLGPVGDEEAVGGFFMGIYEVSREGMGGLNLTAMDKWNTEKTSCVSYRP